jgi:hypothetical protein
MRPRNPFLSPPDLAARNLRARNAAKVAQAGQYGSGVLSGSVARSKASREALDTVRKPNN